MRYTDRAKRVAWSFWLLGLDSHVESSHLRGALTRILRCQIHEDQRRDKGVAVPLSKLSKLSGVLSLKSRAILGNLQPDCRHGFDVNSQVKTSRKLPLVCFGSQSQPFVLRQCILLWQPPRSAAHNDSHNMPQHRPKAINILILSSLACGVLVMSSFAAQACASALGDGRNLSVGMRGLDEVFRDDTMTEATEA